MREYARKAIDTFGGAPVNAAQWERNENSRDHTHANPGVDSGICNHSGEKHENSKLTSLVWMSAEADWGYSSCIETTKPGIDRSLHDKIKHNRFSEKNTSVLS